MQQGHLQQQQQQQQQQVVRSQARQRLLAVPDAMNAAYALSPEVLLPAGHVICQHHALIRTCLQANGDNTI
jgi:hypothetical protein